MTKVNNAKKALISSAFAMLVCVAMLIGTTFAWFTDTASTGVNRIQAGNLKIRLINREEEDLTDKKLQWKVKNDVGNGYHLSDDVLWEPGCHFRTEDFYLVNDGNLAVKYKVNLNFAGDTKLLEALDFEITIIGGDVTSGKKTFNSLEEFNSYEGHLSVDENVKFLLNVYMKTTAGNEYQGLSLGDIRINVVATQYTYEKDSIGDQYDKDATYPNVVTLTADDIAKTSFNQSNTTYYFVGEFDKLTITRENSVSNVAFIADNNAVFNDSVTIHYHAGNRDEKLAANSSLTIKNFNVNGILLVGSRDKNVVIEGNTAKQIKLQMKDVAGDIQILKNTLIDNKDLTNTKQYGFWLDPFVTDYDLTVTGNTFENIGSHAIAVQGSAGEEAITTANSITVKNNTFNSYGTGKAAFKIWEDTVLAPNDTDPVNDAAMAIAKSVKEENTFSDTVKNECVVADFYGKTVKF